MGNIIQHLRGSVVDHSTYTGKKGEISLVTDASEARIPTGEIRIHDDSTPGGLPIVLGTTTNPLTSNIVLGSGVGINFHNYGTGVDSNLLNDYEEGTYQVTLTPTGGSFTMDTNRDTFKYIKIGNVCHVFGYARVSQVSSPTGYVTFNLPFTSAAGTEFSGVTYGICIPENFNIPSNELAVRIYSNRSFAEIFRTSGGGNFGNWISFANNFINDTNVSVMLTYETA